MSLRSSVQSSKTTDSKTPVTIESISSIFKEILVENKNKQNEKMSRKIEAQKKYMFYSEYKPSLSLNEFIQRIHKYTHLETSTLITALMYIDRLTVTGGIILTDANIYRYYL
jgi:hypothetical protein